MYTIVPLEEPPTLLFSWGPPTAPQTKEAYFLLYQQGSLEVCAFWTLWFLMSLVILFAIELENTHSWIVLFLKTLKFLRTLQVISTEAGKVIKFHRSRKRYQILVSCQDDFIESLSNDWLLLPSRLVPHLGWQSCQLMSTSVLNEDALHISAGHSK